MPGLSQLKQFNKDILAIGDEPSLRASRGEHPVRVPIPKTIKDINDSNDFVLGMPENELEVVDTPVDNDLSDIINPNADSTSNIDSSSKDSEPDLDLSSLLNPMGDLSGGSAESEMPDLSAFMDEPVESETEPESEAEPEPVSIADMGLEALLSGTGFDGSDISEIENAGYSSNFNSDEFYTDEELENIAPPEKISKSEKHVGNLRFDEIDDIPGIDKNDYLPKNDGPVSVNSAEQQILSELADIPGLDLSDLGIENTTKMENAETDIPSIDEVADEPEDDSAESLEAFENTDDFTADENFDEPSGDFNLDDLNLDDLGAFDNPESPIETETFDTDTIDAESFEEKNDAQTASSPYDFDKIDISVFPDSDPTHVAEPLNDFDYPDENAEYEEPSVPTASSELDDILNNVEEIESETPKSEFDDLDLDNIEDLGIDVDAVEKDDSDSDSLESIGDFEVYDMNSEEVPLEAVENEGEELEAGLDDFDALEEIPEIGNSDETIESLDALDDLTDLEEIGASGDVEGLEEIGNSDETDGLESLENIDIDSFDIGGSENSGEENLNMGTGDDLGLENLDNLDDLNKDLGMDLNMDLNMDLDEGIDGILEGIEPDEPQEEIADIPEISDNPVDEASNEELDNLTDEMFGGDDAGVPDFQEEIPELSDSSDSSDDLFGVDLDEELSADSSSDDMFADFDASELEGLDFSTNTSASDEGTDNGFDLGNSEDFAFEGSDFEIAGYTDVDIAKEEKKAPVLPTPDFSGAMEGSKLPPNTLSDEQYRQFTENLQTYPLNVRLAFEDLIVRDEFTDDAEFEIIEKIINKVPARQLASILEKMLDISLPVPRDFEHRTAAEYEAYKKSLQYQLRNKIIPGALIAMLCLLVGFGIFQFVRNCIYIPAKAVSLYKQGYALLEADEYPQSELKFNEAVEYKINKKWFFNYARGYRNHKQYQRAEDMYDNILKRFKHDKSAGLEYANMELQDIGNYPKAEEIVRRQVLDWHINDPDGILTLGDTFLEWATEKDPSKFENAREQYATLINLYGAKPMYLSRMMRYFVRTDNLQQVLQLKSSFDNNKKYKYASDDITELSGYLLDKLYGPVTPAEEYLKNRIEGVRGLLLNAVKLNPQNPGAWYNLSRYYINTRETSSIERALQRTILEFNEADTLRARDIYNYIDSYRLLGEYYVGKEDYLKAQEQYTEGLSLYTTERDNAGFAGTEKIGHLYSDLADINYFVSSEYKQALSNYEHAVDLNFDNPQIRYRIGYIQYRNRNYAEALSSFMKASEGNIRHKNLMLAMANTLSLRGDDYAASGYYEGLISILDSEIADEGIVFPQANAKHYDLVNNYLYASNNYGVTLHRLAVRTGDSARNADAIIQFQQSVRAWDALTRNQETMVRLDGSNLALENIRYITHPYSEYEPAIYTDIRKVLTDAEGIK